MSALSPCVLAALLFATSAEAGSTLRGRQALPAQLTARMNRSDIEGLLMGELSDDFRVGATHEHISGLVTELNAMYTAVPKASDGSLSHAVVRYMLHRFFVQKHGWFIRGLEPGNISALEAVSGSNKTLQSLQEWVPSYLQTFLEELHGGRGLSLRELAVLAASLESLIHKESNQRLEMTFTALELPNTAALDQDQLREALEVYMMIYMMGGNFTFKGRERILKAHKVFARKIKDWDVIQQWTHTVQMEVAPGSEEKPLDYSGAARVVEEIGRRYGTFNDGECSRLKSTLLEIESTKAGRVRLADFYKHGLSGSFEFKEKIEYLRALGVVDESNTSEPYVIVPNYVASRPNCLKASSFYVVCCRNECEDLLATIENKFENPTVSPEQVLELVATFSTKTVEGPRTLPETLVRRLNSIADANGGQIPLHGRLFAQWMHHAFPRECPYPHSAGAVSPMTADEWMQANGQDSAKNTDEEMQMIVNSDSCVLPVGPKAREHHHLPENELPWDKTEELLHPGSAAEDVISLAPEAPKVQKRSLFNTAAPMAGIASLLLSVAAMVWKLIPQKKGQDKSWESLLRMTTLSGESALV